MDSTRLATRTRPAAGRFASRCLRRGGADALGRRASSGVAVAHAVFPVSGLSRSLVAGFFGYWTVDAGDTPGDDVFADVIGRGLFVAEVVKDVVDPLEVLVRCVRALDEHRARARIGHWVVLAVK